MATQRSFLNFNSYFSAEGVSIGTVSGQGPSPRKSTVIFGPETSKLPMKSLSRVLFKAGRESLTISIVSKLDFSPVSTVLTNLTDFGHSKGKGLSSVLILDILLKLILI